MREARLLHLDVLVGSGFGPWSDGLWALCQSACAEARGEPVLVLGSFRLVALLPMPWCGLWTGPLPLISSDVVSHTTLSKGNGLYICFVCTCFGFPLGFPSFLPLYALVSLGMLPLFLPRLCLLLDFSLSPVPVQLGTS